MNPILRNVLAVLAGCVVGSFVNIGLIFLGNYVIGVPEGVDFMESESLKANMHLFEFKHFIFPFLAHALGTLVGAIVAAKLAANNAPRLALIVGIFFLIGGTLNMMSIGGPLAFNIIDLVVAYIPMGWLGGRIAAKQSA